MSKWIVSSNKAGLSLQNFLKEHIEGLSGKAAKALIDRFGCRVNGKPEVFSSYKVRRGDVIEVETLRTSQSPPPSLEIIEQTPHYLICNKGPFTPTEEALFKKLLKMNELFLVHRLDKETSGLMIVAKDQQTRHLFEKMFKERNVSKTYHALCQGKISQTSFKVENALGKKASYQGQAIWGEVEKDKGLHALTFFKVLKKQGECALFECQPITGRTHQIRVHLYEKGCPILGDLHYAKDKPFKIAATRVMLHAFSLAFIDPYTKENKVFMAPYPKDFSALADEIFG